MPLHLPFSLATVACDGGESPLSLPCTEVGATGVFYPLAELGFADHAADLTTSALHPRVLVGLPLLNQESYREYWLSPVPVRYGVDQCPHATLHYSENGTVLFGHVLVAEADFPDLRHATAAVYAQLFALLRREGYDYLVRMWNYFPRITALQGELNRYQWFCLGRQDALNQHGNVAYAPPAATAIGSTAVDQAYLQVYFIAAKQAGMQLENPRQTSAFLYPRQYGPVSPAFSRATVKAWEQGERDTKHVYISGTTSIVGHETLHIGDPLAQLDETLRNLEALLQHGDDTLGLPIRAVRDLTQLKVYVHDPAVVPHLQTRLDAYLAGSHATVLYLLGDVCRDNLMVEIEAVFTPRLQFAP